MFLLGFLAGIVFFVLLGLFAMWREKRLEQKQVSQAGNYSAENIEKGGEENA